jgi:3-oxoacyl-(acyl-carrier-protein) synthase
MGCVSPLGLDVPSFWAALIAGKSGIAPIEKIDVTGLRNANGGEVRGFDWSPMVKRAIVMKRRSSPLLPHTKPSPMRTFPRST